MGLWVNYKVRFILFCFLCHGTQSSCVLHGLAHGSVGQLQGEVHFVLFPLSWDTVLLRPSWLSSWVCGSATRSGLFCFVSFVMGHSLFPLSWDTVLLCPSWLSSWVCGSATRSGLFCFVSFVMGHSLFPLSWDTVLLCPSWLSSWVCGSATGSGLFCFVSFVMGHSLFPLSWDTVLLCPSWLSSWVCGSATGSGLFCFVSFVMGHSLFPLSWDTVLLCPSWLSSWVCGSATRSGLFCFVCHGTQSSCVLHGLAHGSVGQLQGEVHFVLFPLSWDTVLLRPSWLSSWVCGSTTRWGSFCFVSFVMGHSPLASFMA